MRPWLCGTERITQLKMLTGAVERDYILLAGLGGQSHLSWMRTTFVSCRDRPRDDRRGSQRRAVDAARGVKRRPWCSCSIQ